MALVCAFAALLLGIATIFGFAPFGASWLPVLTLAALFALWRRAAAPRAAALSGFAFGVGLFGGGVSWVYIALSSFGEMPPLLAALATASRAEASTLYATRSARLRSALGACCAAVDINGVAAQLAALGISVAVSGLLATERFACGLRTDRRRLSGESGDHRGRGTAGRCDTSS